MIQKSRHTKVIFTIGPASQDEDKLVELINAGVDVCRINMAHADHEWTRTIIKRIKKVCERVGRQIAIMMDVKGPEIRTRDVPETYNLEKEELFDFTVGEGVGSTGEDGVRRVDVNYEKFNEDVSVGDTVLVDSGLIRLVVIEKNATRVRCKVVIPGPLGSRRHINLPGVHVRLPALTEKDMGDIDVGIEEGICFFALSFVREADDIDIFRRYLAKHDSRAKIIAKIEDQSAINNLDDIITASDGLMVARGDLGIECPFEDLPIIQARAVDACIHKGKPVIVATHLLESMTESPIPTRAEVSDVATAVREQADCVMLSGETTVGKYPVECVNTLHRIADRIESEQREVLRKDIVLKRPKSKMLRSAAYLASEMKGAGIIIFTRSGFLAQKLSSLRPSRVPIYAFTNDLLVLQQMLMYWGIEPFLTDLSEDPEQQVARAFSMLKLRRWVSIGDPIVVVSTVAAGDKFIDTVQLRTVE